MLRTDKELSSQMQKELHINKTGKKYKQETHRGGK